MSPPTPRDCDNFKSISNDEQMITQKKYNDEYRSSVVISQRVSIIDEK